MSNVSFLIITLIDDYNEKKIINEHARKCLRFSADSGLATAQHVLGMFMYCFDCVSGAKADFLNAVRWIRKAAMQGVMEAQYELGEMFSLGVFSDVHMRFAHTYIRRASRQSHVEAIACMKELRSCVLCGADDAPLACSLCHHARYCDLACSEKHWCEGGGVGGGVHGGAGARHMDTCPRTHTR
jgi:TPR repeat protein